MLVMLDPDGTEISPPVKPRIETDFELASLVATVSELITSFWGVVCMAYL